MISYGMRVAIAPDGLVRQPSGSCFAGRLTYLRLVHVVAISMPGPPRKPNHPHIGTVAVDNVGFFARHGHKLV
jgi:hypothetical protein